MSTKQWWGISLYGNITPFDYEPICEHPFKKIGPVPAVDKDSALTLLESLVTILNNVSEQTEQIKNAPSDERWIPYPENKPNKPGMYLITIQSCIDCWDIEKVHYSSRHGWKENSLFRTLPWLIEKITAFMPTPIPYKKPPS